MIAYAKEYSLDKEQSSYSDNLDVLIAGVQNV